MERRTFYKAEGNSITYQQIEFQYEENTVIVKSGVRGGEQKIERNKFANAELAMDLFFELFKKNKEEDNCFPWTAEIKISMNLEKQKNALSQKEFKDFLESIYCMVDNYLWETINGGISSGIKKIKGSLYSFRVHLIDKEPATQELISKLLVITQNADIVISDGQDKMFNQFPTYTGAKDLEIEIWSENNWFIFLTFTLGDQVFETRFSHVWDPTQDLRRWLEAICIGVEECSFSIQNEGEDVKFNFDNSRSDRGVFYVGWGSNNMTMVEYVDRHQFVKAFYTGYLEFLNPETFTDTKNWDDDLADKFKSKIVEEYLQSNIK